jgi:uncharacterized membrane protein YeaQ/YmgE (transglycosylase-associated protein family)
MQMSLLALIVFGLLTGFVASKIVNKSGKGIFLDIFLGIIGSIAGSWLFHEFGYKGVTGFNLWSGMVAVVGGVVVLLIFHALRRA